jgi:hypothetical protein
MFTMKGVQGQSVVQPANEWLETKGAKDVAIRCEVLNMTGGATLQLQTGPSADGPWTPATYITLTGKITVVLSTEPNSDYKVERYVRWAIDAPLSQSWSTTFQITTCGQATRPPMREEYTQPEDHYDQPGTLAAARGSRLVTRSLDVTNREAPSAPRDVATWHPSAPSARRALGGDVVIQPWTTVKGGFTATGADIVIASEDNWVDTRDMEQVYIQAEMLECTGASYSPSLNIEKSMSLEGPWTTVKTVNSAYTCQNVLLSAEVGTATTYQIENYIRWHISSVDSSWETCFRINARGHR